MPGSSELTKSSALRLPMVQLKDMRTSAFGTVQQAPSASMKTTQSRAASGP
jgi:hypothetical protein